MNGNPLSSPDDELESYDATAQPGEAISKNPYRRYPDPIDPTPGRPHYHGLWEMAGDLVASPGPIPKKLLNKLIDMQLDLREALLPLQPPNVLGLPPDHLKRGDVNAEQERLPPALKKAHDFLKLYAEILKQPPPEDLQHIEQILRNRRDELQRSNSPQTPQP